MTLAKAKVKIEGDASDAKKAFRETGAAADGLTGKLRDARSGLGDMVGGMLTAGAVMGTLRAGVDFVRQATEAYGRENEQVAGGMQMLQRSSADLQAALGGVLLGGDRAGQSMAALSRVVEYLTEVARENEGALTGQGGAMTTVIQGLQMAARFGNGLIDVFGLLKLAAEATAQGAIVLGEGIVGASQALGDLIDYIAGTALRGFASLAGGAISLAETLGAGGLLPSSARETLAEIERLGAGLQDVPPLMDRFERTAFAAANAQRELTDALDLFVADSGRRQEALDAFDGAMEEIIGELQAGTIEVDRFTESQGRAAAAVAVTTDRIKQQAEAIRAKAEADALEAKAKDMQGEQIALEQRAQREADAAARRLFEIEQEKEALRELAAEAERIASARASAAQAVIGSMQAEVAAVVAGQSTIKQAILGTVAAVLEQRAAAYAAEAAALVFVPGFQAQAFGLAGAALAMTVAAAGIRAAGGGGGGGGSPSAAAAGAAPSAPSAPESRNTTINVAPNFGVVGDPRAAAGMIADQVRFAAREGML
jgi:hypothetical protein